MTEPGVLRLLIVEPTNDTRDRLVESLLRAGLNFEWSCVATARAFGQALKEPWDVVLCDYRMPAFEVVRMLEMLKHRDLHAPFILVSGSDGQVVAVAALRSGAHDRLVQSRPTELRSAIERELAKARLRALKRQDEAENARVFADLQRALAARDDFLALASHELRTPLTGLVLEAEALARSYARSGTGAPRGVAAIQRQLAWMNTIVDRCFAVAKFSSGPLLIAARETDLRAVVLDVVDRTRAGIVEAGCALSLDPLESVVGWWDPVHLESVVTNLLTNAIKYGAGKPVAVSTHRKQRRALLSVRDHGIGISPDQQTTLFRKFSRVAPSENYGGLGVGLWIVDQITRAHGGSVSIESRAGAGATFTVDLPLRAESEPTSMSGPA